MHILLLYVVESKELWLSYAILMNIVQKILSKPESHGVFFYSCRLSDSIYLAWSGLKARILHVLFSVKMF